MIKVKIFGKVQGVFFRDTTKKVADSLGIKGEVRNVNNGTVEVIASGKESDLEKLIDWCKKGPRLAKVEKIIVEWEKEKSTNYKDFQIKY